MIVLERPLRGFVGLGDDHGREVVDQDVLSRPPRGDGLGADIGDIGPEHRLEGRGHEDAFGMRCREGLAGARRAGLVEHGCALR